MDERRLSRAQGDVIVLGPSKDFAQRTRYDYIRLRMSESRETTVRNVVAAAEVNQYLAPDKAVTLYLVDSPSGDKCLFAIDADGQKADSIDMIGRDQALARKQAVKWLFISIPLCLVLVGLAFLAAAINGLIQLGKAPKPKDMRAFLAAHPPARRQAAVAPAL
jgi:hypothetical protein